MWALAGIGSQLLGVSAWSAARKGHQPTLFFLVGIALLIASLAIFIGAYGADLGIAWALLTLSIAAYLVVFPPLAQATQIGRDRFRTRPASRYVSRGGKLGLSLRLVAAGPLYLVAALAVGAVIATRMPWAEVNRLMTGALVIPLVWALGALHATADLTIWRVLSIPFIITLVFAGLFLWA